MFDCFCSTDLRLVVCSVLQADIGHCSRKETKCFNRAKSDNVLLQSLEKKGGQSYFWRIYLEAAR